MLLMKLQKKKKILLLNHFNKIYPDYFLIYYKEQKIFGAKLKMKIDNKLENMRQKKDKLKIKSNNLKENYNKLNKSYNKHNKN